jgi:molecular chaperone DnaJ
MANKPLHHLDANEPNPYQVLEVSRQATQEEIKQAYRRLVKQFHPDRYPHTQTLNSSGQIYPNQHGPRQNPNQHGPRQNPSHNPSQTSANHYNHELIAKINAAYEILGDPHHRLVYDQQLQVSTQGLERAAAAQSQHQQRPTSRDTDAHLAAWLQNTYRPVNQFILTILKPLTLQLENLAADPFDDDLLSDFQAYLDDCREQLANARQCFQSMPNPANLAGVAANLYYCLNQISDGLDDLEMFPRSYDDHYLHTGQELFRIAKGLRREAAASISHLG